MSDQGYKLKCYKCLAYDMCLLNSIHHVRRWFRTRSYYRFCTNMSNRMPHVEQGLLTLLEWLRSSKILAGCCLNNIECVSSTIVYILTFFCLRDGVVTLFSTSEFECNFGIFRLSIRSLWNFSQLGDSLVNNCTSATRDIAYLALIYCSSVCYGYVLKPSQSFVKLLFSIDTVLMSNIPFRFDLNFWQKILLNFLDIPGHDWYNN